jgi:pSer/pThr/pTyr-binding forkhead associated (FHA) protein
VRWIEDLQSLNGTLVNGFPVTRQALSDGDEIQMGDTRLNFRVAPPAAATSDAAGAQD